MTQVSLSRCPAVTPEPKVRQTWSPELDLHPQGAGDWPLQLPQAGKPGPPRPGRQAHPPAFPPILVMGCLSPNMSSATTGRRGAWAEAGRQTCFVWPSTVPQKNLNWLPALKSQISHKNPDFWLLWTNQWSLAALGPYPRRLQFRAVCTQPSTPHPIPTAPCSLTAAPLAPRELSFDPSLALPGSVALPSASAATSRSSDVLPTLQGLSV